MRKIIAVVIAIFLGFSASAKAWTNYINLGIRFPGTPLIGEVKSDNSSVKIDPIIDASFGYTGVLSNGFTVRATFDVGYADSDIKLYGESSLPGLNVEALAGVGFAPLRTKHFFLGLYGLFGVNTSVFSKSEKTFFGSYSDKQEFTQSLTYGVFGINATFIATFTKTFSLYASLTGDVLFGGESKCENNDNGNKTSASFTLNPKFMLVPSVGIAWKF